ncbi:MAG: GspH/FimT family pseudopilin [Colwellia sp.]
MLHTSMYCPSKRVAKISVTTGQLKSCLGMTLIELMVSVSITSILTAIALPNLHPFIVQLRVDNEISRLGRLLLVARNYAINSGDKVILCPLNDDGTCSIDWHKELSVFVDSNGNRKFDMADNELLISTKSPIVFGDILKYGTNRDKITYQATGHLFGLSNGTFKYCPEGYEYMSRGVVVARSGRFYTTTDTNLDGRDETRSNKVISCD